MTFCIGIRVREGIVALSDTRVVRGSELSRKAKLTMLRDGNQDAILMSSGLRSVRDKIVVRLEDQLMKAEEPHRRLHELASAYGDTLRSVRAEDEDSLSAAGLSFNSHAIIGGQFDSDPEPVLIHVYPEGNWVEATDDAPYFVIGRSTYGKPILDRLLGAESALEDASTLAYLAFDATRTSATDVDFPIDLAVLRADRSRFAMQRFTESQLADIHGTWQKELRDALDGLPRAWMGPLLEAHTNEVGS